jgi:hypothetical protein
VCVCVCVCVCLCVCVCIYIYIYINQRPVTKGRFRTVFSEVSVTSAFQINTSAVLVLLIAGKGTV